MQKKNLSILSITLGRGGAEKVISLLLKKLIKDYNVTLILFYDNIHFPIPEDVNVVIFNKEITDKPFLSKAFDAVRFIKKYNGILKSEKIDYTISFLAFPNLINGIISIFNKNVKTIISERGFPSDNTTSKLSFYISKLFYPVFYNKCDKLFSNSTHINNDLKDNFGIKIPMEVIYNPIEIPQKTIKPISLNTPTPGLNIITAGTLNIRKNQIMIIRSIKNDKSYKLNILGDGHLKEYLTNEIKLNNLLDNVFLKGSVKNVNDYLLESNCFVLSSFTEGFPNALLEAMAIGLPCISTNCFSGPLELLHDNKPINIKNGTFFKADFGLLVNNNDHEGLSKALAYYKENPNERERFSKLSLDRSSKYHLNNIYAQFNEFIIK